MGRGKVQLKRVENPVYRQITFCKRRGGLIKKAKELAVLCDAEIGVFVFSDHDKLYESTTNVSMQSLIARYKNNVSKETMILKKKNDLLRKGLRYMNGGEVTSSQMTLDELQDLESMFEELMHHIRSTKTGILSQQIKMLKDQEGVLQATNQILQEKMVETNWRFLEPIVMASNVPYPPINLSL